MANIAILDANILGFWGFGEIVIPDNTGQDTYTPYPYTQTFQDFSAPENSNPHPGTYIGGTYTWDLQGRPPGDPSNYAAINSKPSGVDTGCLDGIDPTEGLECLISPFITGFPVAGIGEQNAIPNTCTIPFHEGSPFWNLQDFTIGLWTYWFGENIVHKDKFGPGTGYPKDQALLDCSRNVTGNTVNGFRFEVPEGRDHLFFVSSGEGGGNAFSLDFGQLGGTEGNGWTFIVLTAIPGVGLRAYKDGIRQDEYNGSFHVDGSGDRFTIFNRDTNGPNDFGDSWMWNGGIDDLVLLDRGLTDKEVWMWYLLGCKPIARIRKKVPVTYDKQVPPAAKKGNYTPIKQPTPNGTPGATTVNITIQADGIYPLPPNFQFPYEAPPLNGADHGAVVYGQANNNPGSGIIDWPTHEWTPLTFAHTSYHWTNYGPVSTGSEYQIQGCDLPDLLYLNAVDSNGGWFGPAADPSGAQGTYSNPGTSPEWKLTNPGYPFLFPHKVYRADELIGPYVIAMSDVLWGGYYDTGVIDPDYWNANYPHPFDGDHTFTVTHGNEALLHSNPGAFGKSDFFIWDTWTVGGVAQLPSAPDWGLANGWNFKTKRMQNTTFKGRIRNITTGEVCSLHITSGYEMSFYTVGQIILTGANDQGIPYAHDARGQHSFDPRHLRSGDQFVAEVWHDYGETLTKPVWREFRFQDRWHWPGQDLDSA